MNIRNLTLLLILAAVMAFTGCHAENFKKKWPKYPDWGWWKHPAGETDDSTENLPDKTVPSMDRPDLSKSTESSESHYPSTPITDPQLLAEYRQSIWPEAKQLRNLDEIPPEQRQEYVAHTIQMLPQWYAPLQVDPPDTNDPDWTTVVIWDFMPEQEFTRAAEAYENIAKQQSLPFPKYVTRRELMQFILQLTGGDNKPKQEQPLVPIEPKKGI
jgi:hypothetical protein